MAVAGPPAISEYNGATFQASFVGDRSFALGIGATLTGFLWTAPGSVEGTSISQGTVGSPVIFTWTSPGQKLVYLTVTDSNGKTHTNYTWAFGIDPNNIEDVAYTNFDASNDNFDFEQGGGQCSFTVHGNADIANFPGEALVILASRPTTQLDTPTGSWPNRTNVHFVGHILGNTVRQNPIEGDVTFRAATVDALMKNVTSFPVSLTFRHSPARWTQAKDLTPDRAASYLWHYYSTLSLMAPIQPSNYDAFIQRQDFGPSNMFSQLDNELLRTMWGKVVVNHQGVVHHMIDYNLMLAAERAAVSVRKTLHKGVWVDNVTIEEKNEYSLPTSVVKMSGVYYPGGDLTDVCPLFSEAPGNAPKVYGNEVSYDRLILTSQGDLNIRSGFALAKLNAKYAPFNMRFINDGSFTIAPQELFPSNIEANDNNRGLALTTRLIPRRINRSYDHELGLISYDVGFEPETTGPAGQTVNLPCGPPEQELLNPPPIPPQASAPLSLAAATNGESFYFATTAGQIWDRRVTGLTSLDFLDMIKDPWSDFKNGISIDQIIMWGCGPGFLVRTADSGYHWGDRTSYLNDPPNSWNDAIAPTITGSHIKQIVGNLFNEDHFYLLVQSIYSGTFRGWIYRSTDDGFNFTPYALTGTSQALPLRMDVDKETGSILWVTLREGNGNINLRKYSIGATLSLSSTIVLVTGTTMDSEQVAYPFAPFGDKDLIFVYGFMNTPQGLVSTNQVIKSTNGGVSWQTVVNDWGLHLCASLFVSAENVDGQRGMWAVKQAL